MSPEFCKIIFFVLLANCCTRSSASDSKAPLFDLNERLGWCIESCTPFRLIISERGDLEYFGMKVHTRAGKTLALNALGVKHAKLTIEQVTALRKYFLSMPFAEYHGENYDRRAADSGHGVIDFESIETGIKIKVDNNFFFGQLICKINSFVPIEDWLCFSKGHPNFEQCTKRLRRSMLE